VNVGHRITEYDYDDACRIFAFIETLWNLGIASKYDVDCAAVFKQRRKTTWDCPGDQFTG
jgi:hypothetical protein